MANSGIRGQGAGERVAMALIDLFMVLFCIAVVIPFLNIVAVSLSGKQAVISGRVTFWPVDFGWGAYQVVFSSAYFIRSYGNTLFVVVVGTAISLVLTAFAAYPLSTGDLPGKRAITFLIALTMWFSGGMIPTFLIVKQVGLYDSLFALILSGAISAFNVIIVRNFFSAIPEALVESANLDGANDLVILFRIFVPLSLPVMATVTLWLAVGYWNSFMPALLYLQTRAKFPLQLVLRDIVMTNTMKQYVDASVSDDTLSVVSESIKYANIILTMLPILMVYPFLQKYFIKGVLIGAVKG